MSTSQDFMDYLFDQIDNKWNKRYRKMFGEYMFYINDKPILLVCDNTVYINIFDCVSSLVQKESKGFPYKGSKEHYIIEIEDKDLLNKVIDELVKVIPIPIKKKKKSA